MNKINDGGPAFPTGLKATRIEMAGGRYEGTHVAEYAAAAPGITLRDYFAAKALQGLLADPSTNTAINSTDRDFIEREQQKFADLTARAAYRMADAMLRARGEA
ncbi:hypothetical protein [Burkholderia multivorans]|uniref:hypothetical protein n=1 Tax=Burkholderia multivorans TaxID=87883 RepID=UPI0021C0D94F|nr:hypothetical protein [Burkholderia multivorans]MDR9051735.1 hypothetical protein [Burkholderia multivorans]MDR9057727.1 hypothetical protein [Burkholderia multivorans]MDR9064638.1 hypothetical protein [Burkholderia multivorans]MDR9069751.1 hypothetical protein [Burkholderia multivorans]MDR9076831.1 hypothetical protein [Burkholderia multivorans]